ncbi:DNA-directed RNA polymerase subunit delta [Lacticigenium naphthae]|uniref:DNA-directed RNA polymerase subunit delta n=1 Tax=Lacticigenium naphthae TaxID=515351 RepID=UPI0004163D67|nr:DNA-directed RNA polymerase subunit delta [Lacticigenium naphthae]
MELMKFKGQNKNELAMIDVALAILEEQGKVIDFNDISKLVASYLELSDKEVKAGKGQFYTDLNIDGRFISLGENRWGLREWYPLNSIDEEITHDNDEEDERPRRKKRKKKYGDFDGYDEDIEDDDIEDDDDEIEYGDRVEVDEHGVMVDDDDDEDLGEYKKDLSEIDDDDEDDEELKGLTIIDEDDEEEEA